MRIVVEVKVGLWKIVSKSDTLPYGGDIEVANAAGCLAVKVVDVVEAEVLFQGGRVGSDGS